MTTQPLITVGMPVYNGEKYLAESIESIRKQTYSNWELILLDDASHDNSGEIAKYFAGLDSRIRYEKKEHNKGLVSARNSIVNLACGDFLAWNDQDDLSFSTRLQEQVQFLLANPKVGICGSWTYAGPSVEESKLLRVPTGWSDIRAFMPFYNPISCNTVIMNLQHLPHDQNLFYDKAGLALDYDLWARLVLKTEIRNIKRPTSFYRSHGAQNSLGEGQAQISNSAIAIQEKFLRNTLDIRWTDDQRKIHSFLTQSPIVWQEGASLEAIEAYLLALHSANRNIRAFGQRNFERVLGYTWLRTIKAGLASPQARPGLIRTATRSSLTLFTPDTLRYRFGWKFGFS